VRLRFAARRLGAAPERLVCLAVHSLLLLSLLPNVGVPWEQWSRISAEHGTPGAQENLPAPGAGRNVSFE
jgi:hypothetical protein